MIQAIRKISVASAGLCAVALPVVAHHSFSAVFDATKPVVLSGTVVRFDFVNPHSWVTMDVVPAGEAAQRWRVEVANPNALLRLGWKKDSVKPGDQITVDGFKARDGSNTAIGKSFTLASGEKVLGGISGDPTAAPAPSQGAAPPQAP